MRSIAWMCCVLLAGCATTVDKQFASLEQARPCCTSISEFEFEPLPAKGSKFKLEVHASVFDFDSGRSYFKAFELPGTGLRRFRVKTYFNGMWIGQYLDPVLLILDAEHREVARGALSLRFDDGNLFGDQNAHLFGFFAVDDEARYLVVLTAPFESEAPVAKTDPSVMVTMIGQTPIASPTPGTSIRLHRSPTGTVRVEPLP
ncbi:MAG: hypothetical protein H4O13_17785 [Xanthomonadales bacterium]|nr:hypothetical protein [Xanthomonadales bacterium]